MVMALVEWMVGDSEPVLVVQRSIAAEYRHMAHV